MISKVAAQPFARCSHYLFLNGIPLYHRVSSKKTYPTGITDLTTKKAVRSEHNFRQRGHYTESRRDRKEPQLRVVRYRGLLNSVQHYKASKSLDFSSSRPQDSGSDSNEDDEVSRGTVEVLLSFVSIGSTAYEEEAWVCYQIGDMACRTTCAYVYNTVLGVWS